MIRSSSKPRVLVDIYESGDPSTLEVFLGARSIQDALDRSSYFAAIADQDKQIVKQVTDARVSLQAERVATRHLRDRILAERRVVAYRAAQEFQVRAALLSAQGSLVGARDSKQHALAATQGTVREWQQEASSLSAASAQIQAQITAAQAKPATPAPSPNGSPASPPSSAGLVWPVSGPITSPYGMRWGSLHPGIDIGAGMGTPILPLLRELFLLRATTVAMEILLFSTTGTRSRRPMPTSRQSL